MVLISLFFRYASPSDSEMSDSDHDRVKLPSIRELCNGLLPSKCVTLVPFQSSKAKAYLAVLAWIPVFAIWASTNPCLHAPAKVPVAAARRSQTIALNLTDLVLRSLDSRLPFLRMGTRILGSQLVHPQWCMVTVLIQFLRLLLSMADPITQGSLATGASMLLTLTQSTCFPV